MKGLTRAFPGGIVQPFEVLSDCRVPAWVFQFFHVGSEAFCATIITEGANCSSCTERPSGTPAAGGWYGRSGEKVNTLSRSRTGGFTLFELLVVVAISLVIATISLPAMSGFFKTSKIEQGTEAVRIALTSAQLQAMRSRTSVGIYFDYPQEGMMEIWTFRSSNDGSWVVTTPDGIGGELGYSAFETPGYYKVHRVANRSYRVPTGVKVIGAFYDTSTGDISWPKWSDTPTGRLKAHWMGFQLTGKKIGWSNRMFCYTYYVVIDEGSGEYAIVHHGDYQMGRPRTHFDWVIRSVEGTPVSDPLDIWPLMKEKAYPYDPGVIVTGS